MNSRQWMIGLLAASLLTAFAFVLDEQSRQDVLVLNRASRALNNVYLFSNDRRTDKYIINEHLEQNITFRANSDGALYIQYDMGGKTYTNPLGYITANMRRRCVFEILSNTSMAAPATSTICW
jgi:hypothetical protein